jgi:outer membrane protein OmpA-like peptidoglycan-associated protein/tetratricopeptide (TPR) repeat protein
MKKFTILGVMWILPFVLMAQSTNISTLFHRSIKKADHYYDHLAYRNALQVYLHAIENDPGNYHVRERIATCYFMLHDPVSSEFWFSSLAKEPDIHPEAKLNYGRVLSMNGKYEEAKYWIGQYLKNKPEDPLAQRKFEFLEQVNHYAIDAHRFVVSPADYINTDHSDYGAHYFHSGIVFASSRDKDLLIKHKPFDGVHPDESLLNLYYAERKITGDWEAVKSFHANHLKTYYHEGPMAFYDNYKKGAFTQSNIKKDKPVYDATGRVNLQIYFAEVAHLGELKNIKPFEYNNDGYSNAHPSFTEDGKVMFFSSTAATGHGGSDIYYSTFENGRWTEPVNAGSEINTREDESFPFLSNDTTLYFSSNGHGSLGGLDIYVSYRRNGKFTKPVNLGYPMNTQYDDFSLVCDSTGRIGYMASNRPGGKGLDDIYFFIANYYFLAGEVRELSREQAKLPGTKIVVHNMNGDFIDSVRSDENGNFRLNLPYDQDFLIRGERDGYETLEDLHFTTRGKPFGVDSLMLPMWKYKMFAKGRIFSNESQALLPGATVLLHNITDDRMDSVVVDKNGEYTFLVRPNKRYEITASKEGFIASGFKLNTKDLYEGDLLNDIVLEEIYIEKEVIFFDFNKYDLTAQALKQMNRIVRTLKRYSRATLNIGAHADSRGSAQYNKRLSDNRAKAALDYFVSQGIAKSRIEAIGFGEELILNRCSDGVECPEEEHSKNRRGEIKVQRTRIN